MSVAMVLPGLFTASPVVFDSVGLKDANALLVGWGHRLGALRRPFGTRAYLMLVDGRPVSLALSASIVSATVAGYRRQQVVELARLCSAPGHAWASRVMLRIWREVFAPRWPDWPVLAAVSYSHNAHHRGDLYRFDGWARLGSNCGSSGGGAWTQRRYAGDVVAGPKTLWVWRYQPPTPPPPTRSAR
jgi:hypothetical protein